MLNYKSQCDFELHFLTSGTISLYCFGIGVPKQRFIGEYMKKLGTHNQKYLHGEMLLKVNENICCFCNLSFDPSTLNL